MSTGAVVVRVPWLVPGSLRWRVGVGDLWGEPGDPLPAPPGATTVTLVLELASEPLWLHAITRFQVNVVPEGTTQVALRVAPLLAWLGASEASYRPQPSQ